MFQKRELGQEMAFGKIPAYCQYELYMERYRSVSDFAQAELSDRDALSILDIGSGRGRLKYFIDFSDRIEWHGVEVSDEMMQICTDIGYRMYKHDIEAAPLPFEDESFDLVTGLHVLEHLSDCKNPIKEMVRVLKPGGILVLGVPTKPPLIAELIGVHYRNRQKRHPQQGRTCNSFSPRSFSSFVQRTIGDKCKILDVCGFRVFSARRRLALENLRWFYIASTWFGRHFPSLTPEVNVILKKVTCQQPPERDK